MKKSLRRNMRATLRSLSAESRHEKALAAAKRMLATEAWSEARAVFVFLSMEYEIDTTALLDAAWRDRKRVLAPKVEVDARRMVPIEIQSWSECLPGFRGIVEPIGGASAPVSRIDLVVVPGLVFDGRGHRLGQGGGFYDRFLGDPALRARRCGFAFEEQVVDKAPVEAHDQPMHVLVTDMQVRTFELPTVA